MNVHEAIIGKISEAFREIEKRVPPPIRVESGDSFEYRPHGKTIHEAAFLKASRVVSGLSAILVLNQAGLTQEQAAIHRMLDDIIEDVMFLTFAIIKENQEQSHLNFLEEFFQEDFAEIGNPSSGRLARAQVPRKKIKAFLSRQKESSIDPSSGLDALKTLHQSYSGFVHANAISIMESYGGSSPDTLHFHIEGLNGTPPQSEHLADMSNQFYRGYICFIMLAKAFGVREVGEKLEIELDKIGQDLSVSL